VNDEFLFGFARVADPYAEFPDGEVEVEDDDESTHDVCRLL